MFYCQTIVYKKGKGLIVQFIDLEGAGDIIEEDIANNGKWHKLPYDKKIEKLLETSEADKHYAFEDIQEGYYVLSGVCPHKDEVDFNPDNFDSWCAYSIGFWDTYDETLYFISVTNE